MVEPFDEWLAEQDAPVQVFAWTWARLATGLLSTPDAINDDEKAGGFLEVMDALAQGQSEYTPEMDDVDAGANPVPDVVGAQLGGIWEDLTDAEGDTSWSIGSPTRSRSDGTSRSTTSRSSKSTR